MTVVVVISVVGLDVSAVDGGAVDRGVVGLVDSAEVVTVPAEGVVARTVGDVVSLGVWATAFETGVDAVSVSTPATVGRVVCAADEEEPLTIGCPLDVGAGVAAWAAQRQRPATAKRMRTDFMNELTVHLPWEGARGGGKRTVPGYHSDSCMLAINALAKGNEFGPKGKELAAVQETGPEERYRASDPDERHAAMPNPSELKWGVRI